MGKDDETEKALTEELRQNDTLEEVEKLLSDISCAVCGTEEPRVLLCIPCARNAYGIVTEKPWALREMARDLEGEAQYWERRGNNRAARAHIEMGEKLRGLSEEIELLPRWEKGD